MSFKEPASKNTLGEHVSLAFRRVSPKEHRPLLRSKDKPPASAHHAKSDIIDVGISKDARNGKRRENVWAIDLRRENMLWQ